MIEQPARTRRVVAPENVLAIGDQPTEPLQQVGAAFEADQRIVGADLEAALRRANLSTQ